MSLLNSAVELAAKGFHVFPLVPESKLPAIKEYPTKATRDLEQITKWWGENPNYNVGISTSKYGDDEALFAIDVDNKGDKKGDEEIIRLTTIEGLELPDTFEQRTPTGGKHFVYRVREPLKQGAGVLGRGLDTRSRGGYLVGTGSRLPGGVYSAINRDIKPAPDWIVSRFSGGTKSKAPEREVDGRVDRVRATTRAIRYLEEEAPLAVEGSAGDATTFKVACHLKDIGLAQEESFRLMAIHWNDRCSPPWKPDELFGKIENAYKYGAEPVGVSAPEVEFDPIAPSEDSEDFISRINEDFAFVCIGSGHAILWEKNDPKGNRSITALNENTFHKLLSQKQVMQANGKLRAATQIWMNSPRRKTYSGLCFVPRKEVSPKYFNMWRGFSVEPPKPGEVFSTKAKESLDMFIEHTRENVARGIEFNFRWVMGYFAQMIQRPWEKPLVALVFRGGKGVGKNALVDRVGHLLGSHYMLTADKRYLTSSFNSHLEKLVLFTLDEAFWSGDKQVEGILKSLITGRQHVIERKGLETYSVDNCVRVCILGNEEWLVPASNDERRFAVFDVGDKRKQDIKFFRDMREGMEDGGYRLLLEYLDNFDLTGIDIDRVPVTEALKDQKEFTHSLTEQWWFECLDEGKIVGSDLGEFWVEEVGKSRVYEAFKRFCREQGRGAFLVSSSLFTKQLKKVCPSLNADIRKRDGEKRQRFYGLPSLKQARADWEKQYGKVREWNEDYINIFD